MGNQATAFPDIKRAVQRKRFEHFAVAEAKFSQPFWKLIISTMRPQREISQKDTFLHSVSYYYKLTLCVHVVHLW